MLIVGILGVSFSVSGADWVRTPDGNHTFLNQITQVFTGDVNGGWIIGDGVLYNDTTGVKVGIGTIPSEALHVIGNVLATGFLKSGGGFSSGGVDVTAAGDVWMDGSLFLTGNITTVTVSDLSINGSLIPWIDDVFTMGNSSHRYKSITIGTGTSHMGGDFNLSGTFENGLVGWWTLDEDGGTDGYADSSRNGNTLSYNGKPKNITGIMGGAIALDGSNDYIDRDTKILSAYPFTVGAWIKWVNDTAASGNQHFTIISIADSSVSNKFYAIRLTSVGEVAIVAMNTVFKVSSGGDILTENEWHRILGVFESAEDRKVYLDGVLTASDTDSVDYASTVDRFSVGRQATSGSSLHYFNGSIDEPKVWSRALSAREAAEDYKQGSLIHGGTVNGDLIVVGNFTGNQIYGEMNVHEETSAVTVIGAANDEVNVTTFRAGLLNGVTSDGGGLISLINGTYKVAFDISFSGGANADIEHIIHIDGAHQHTCHTSRKLGAAGDTGSVGAHCFLKLGVGNNVTLAVNNTDNGNDITVEFGTVSILRVGD